MFGDEISIARSTSDRVRIRSGWRCIYGDVHDFGSKRRCRKCGCYRSAKNKWMVQRHLSGSIAVQCCNTFEEAIDAGNDEWLRHNNPRYQSVAPALQFNRFDTGMCITYWDYQEFKAIRNQANERN